LNIRFNVMILMDYSGSDIYLSEQVFTEIILS